MNRSAINAFSRELEALQSKYGIVAMQLFAFYREDDTKALRNFGLLYHSDDHNEDHINALNRVAFDAASDVIQNAPGAHVISESVKIKGTGDFVDPDNN